MFFSVSAHRANRIRRLLSIEESGIDRDAMIAERAIFRCDGAVGGRRNHRNFQAVLRRELEVALILTRRGHNRAGAVAHQDVVGDPDGNVLAVEQIARVGAGENPGLFLDRREPFDLGLATRVGDVGLDRRTLPRRGDVGDQRMLRRHHHERDAKYRIGTRGEEADFLAGMSAYGKRQFRALRPADPVPLHQLDRLGPVDLVEVVEQAVGVVGHLEEPLLEILTRDRIVGMTPTTSVDDLLVGQDRAALVAPPLRTHPTIGEAALVQQEKEPLRPLVVFWC